MSLKIPSLRLRYWILAGYSIPVIALISSAIVTDWNARSTKAAVSEVDRSALVNFELEKAATSIQMMSRNTRGYLLKPHPLFEQKFEEAASAYETHFEKAAENITNEEQTQRLDELIVLAEDLRDLGRQLIDVAKADPAAARELWEVDLQRNQADSIDELLAEIITFQDELVAANLIVQNRALNDLRTLIKIVAIGSTLASILVGLWIVRRIANQMNASASSIASSTAEIATTVQQQEATIQQQATSVNQTSTTMDELGVSSQESAKQASAAVSGASQALVLAENGARAVELTLKGMGALEQKVQAIAEQILRLSEQTKQIGSISSLVSDLANQTNVLALNAAVEAVRAEEHSQGFGVVASEIRKLADQSKRSAEKINGLVLEIQNAINATVMATDEGSQTVEEGVRIAQETAEAFAGVTDAVNTVVLNSQHIASNVEQQATAIQQVVGAMNMLNLAASDTAAGITLVRQGTQDLNTAASQLEVLV